MSRMSRLDPAAAILPYLAVLIGLYLIASAWVTILLYHLRTVREEQCTTV